MKYRPAFQSVIGFHQIIGGLIGLFTGVFHLIETGQNIFNGSLMFIVFTLSIVSGYYFFNGNPKAEHSSILNYVLQVIGVSVEGLFFFNYNLPLSLQVGYDFSEAFAILNIELVTGFLLSFSLGINDILIFNISSFVILCGLVFGDRNIFSSASWNNAPED